MALKASRDSAASLLRLLPESAHGSASMKTRHSVLDLYAFGTCKYAPYSLLACNSRGTRQVGTTSSRFWDFLLTLFSVCRWTGWLPLSEENHESFHLHLRESTSSPGSIKYSTLPGDGGRAQDIWMYEHTTKDDKQKRELI